MKKVKRPVWIAILVIAILILLCGIYFIMRAMLAQDEIPGRSDFTRPAATEAADSTEAPTEPPTEAPTIDSFGYELESYEDWQELDFDSLLDINPDICGWIYIPGTNVDYPIAQSLNGDDNFYLSHNIYGQYQFSGTIYSQSMNRRDFKDPVTVLYGHNMLNGSMFATLHRFSDEDFFNKHTTCFVRTRDRLLTYLIYSAYVYDDRHIMNSFDFHNEGSLMSYLDSTLDPRTYSGIVREGIELSPDSRVLTLSTCTNGGSNTRFLVQGVLVDEQLRE